MQPTPYSRLYDFSQDEVNAVSGRSTVRTDGLDAELDAIALTLSETLVNLSALQRDDGLLIDNSVRLHTLSAEVLALMGSGGFTIHDPLGWLTATAYAVGEIVTEGTGTYVCAVAHTSGTFATDLAADKWVAIFDTTNFSASGVSFSPTGGVAATNVQAAIAEVDSESAKKASNLSDLSNVATARTNLSVQSKAEAQQGVANVATAAGTPDVITVALTPTVSGLTNNLPVVFEASGANTTSTPTLNVDGTGAKTIVRPDGAVLYAGDIPAAGARAICYYDTSSDKYILANPFYAITTTPLQTISPSQITADQNDYNPSGLSTAGALRIHSDARRTITGIAGGTDGRELTLHNVGEYPIVIAFQSSGSTAANRFAFGHVLSGEHSMKVAYDVTTGRWRCTFKQLPAGTHLDHMGGTVPDGTLAEDGSNVSRTTYAALFREIGTTHGVGDGSTTFGLPDTRRRVNVGSGGTGTGTLGNAVGNTGGEEAHTPTVSETALHAHNTAGGGNVGGGSRPQNIADTSDGIHNWSTDNNGSGNAFNVMQPSMVVTKVIVY